MQSEGQTVQQLATEIEFPPLKIVARDFEPELLPKESKYRPDATFDFEWEGESRKFVVALKRISTPAPLMRQCSKSGATRVGSLRAAKMKRICRWS